MTTVPRRVAVLYTSEVTPGLPPGEHQAEDLTANARTLAKALRSDGTEVGLFPFGADPCELGRRLRRFGPAIVFNLAEGPLGCYAKEAHAVTFLELLGLPYTGNGLHPIVLCKNKALSKQLLVANSIPTPPFCVCDRPPRKTPALRYPLVVKPLRQDGSQGITDRSVVYNLAELKRAVAEVLRAQRQEALVEQFVGGREFNVGLIGNGTGTAPYHVLPAGELVYHSQKWRVCTFEAKWDEAHPSYAAVEAVCPAKLTHRLRRRLEELSLASGRLFELTGYSRLDFRLDARGEPQLLDINPNPDLAPRMGLARAAEAAGLNYVQLLQEILRYGLAQSAR
jgi:D-alanine-D-alanine ligase